MATEELTVAYHRHADILVRFAGGGEPTLMEKYDTLGCGQETPTFSLISRNILRNRQLDNNNMMHLSLCLQ